jgi:3-hydroxyisobutyrate dehydrogenase
VMVGGTEPVFKRLKPMLGHLGTEITHCGGPGAGQATKLINNMVLFQNVMALGEALNLARRAGLSATKVFATLSKGSADSFALRNHGMKSMLTDNYPERAFPLEYALKDMEYLLEFAKQAKADLKGAKRAMEVMEKSAVAGNRKRYFPVATKSL